MSDEKNIALAYDALTNAEKIYNFEFLFAEALRLAFEAEGLAAYNVFVIPEFQKDRGRVEVVFVPGAGRGIWHLHNGTQRECAWKGEYVLGAITEANPAEHAHYVSLIREFMHRLPVTLNETALLPYHCIHNFAMDAGTAQVVATEEGYFRTTLRMTIDFSVQSNAWALLTT